VANFKYTVKVGQISAVVFEVLVFVKLIRNVLLQQLMIEKKTIGCTKRELQSRVKAAKDKTVFAIVTISAGVVYLVQWLVYRLDDQGIEVQFQAGPSNFSLPKNIKTGSGAHPAPYSVGTGGTAGRA